MPDYNRHECECDVCGTKYLLSADAEPTDWCNLCAQKLLPKALAYLAQISGEAMGGFVKDVTVRKIRTFLAKASGQN